MAIQIGPLQERLVFESRAEQSDIYGNAEIGDWTIDRNIWIVHNIWGLPNVWNPTDEQAAVWGYFRPQFGREQMEAGRNESTMLGVLTIRSSVGAFAIDASYRARFTYGRYNGMICQIRSVVPTPDRRYTEMRLEQGVAT